MKHRALQDLIGRAIVDRDFREELLNGDREQVIAEFDLTDDEISAINSIDSNSFEDFASELDSWIEVRRGTVKRRRSSLFGLFK